MKIGLVGAEHLKLKKLRSKYDVENILLSELQSKIHDYALIILESDLTKKVPVIDIPKSCLLLNLFKIGKTNIEIFSDVFTKPDQLNFLVEFPGMRDNYLEDALESALLKLPYKSISPKTEGQFFDITILKKLTSKPKWLSYFQTELKKRVLVDNSNFFKGVSTVTDELILNSFIHGYGIDLDDVKNSQSGKVIIRWGIDQQNIVIKVTDLAGNFDFVEFLSNLKISRSADEIAEEDSGGLGILMTINFVDHIEIASIKSSQTIVKIYIDLDRILFSRRGRAQRASFILKSTPLIDDFE